MTRVPAVLIGGFPDRDIAARAALRRWADEEAPLELASIGASFTFRCDAPGGQLYLRLMPPGWQSDAELRGEIAFVQHLHQAGIAVAPPVPSRAGAWVEPVDTSIGRCLATAFEGLRGPSPVDRDWSPPQAFAVGALMARMHDASMQFALPPGAERLSWRQEFSGLAGNLDSAEAGLWQIAHETRALFERLPVPRDSYGLIHYDLSGDNLVWRDAEPAAIDFDDCMTHWYVADLARSIAHYRMQDRPDLEAPLLDGYGSVRALADPWPSHLPAFIRFSLLCELAWMTHARRTRAASIEFTDADEAQLRRLVVTADENVRQNSTR
jgi:Ser/Thr protein kinase RdoA (MazF antagonist)